MAAGQPPEILPQIAERKRHGAQAQRQQDHRQQDRGKKRASPQHRRSVSGHHAARGVENAVPRAVDSCLGRAPPIAAKDRIAANRSGCSARASCSMASTRRGDGRSMASLSTMTRPLRTRFEIAPAGPLAQFPIRAGSACGLVAGKNQILGLQPHHLFEAHVRPILRRLNHRARAGPAQRVGEERVASDGDERVLPHHEEHAFRLRLPPAARARSLSRRRRSATTAWPASPAPDQVGPAARSR